MVLEDKEIIPFFEWLPVGLSLFLFTVLIVIGVGVFIGYLVSSLRYGPARALGVDVFGDHNCHCKELSFKSRPAANLGNDHVSISRSDPAKGPGRVCFVFLVLLLFAGWFLDPNGRSSWQALFEFCTDVRLIS